MSAGEVLDRLGEAIDEVAILDPSDMGTADALGELLERLQSCMHRLEFQFHRLLRSFEARGDCVPLGYRTSKQWCVDRLAMSGREAAATLKLGRMLIEMPTVAEHWSAGRLGAEHARVVSSACTEDTRDQFAEWESWLADRAIELDHRRLQIAVKRWKLRADPDGDEPDRIERDRDAHVSETFQGTVVADAVLPAIGGATFKAVFDRLVDELFKHDWADAKTRLGRDPGAHELTRSHAQRRADALVEMAVRAQMCRDPHTNRPRPLVIVVAGLEAVADGGPTTPTNGRVACSPDNRARPRRRFHADPDP